MLNNYVYLLSSLPMLHFGSQSPISSAKLLSSCEGLVDENVMDALGAVFAGDISSHSGTNGTLSRWSAFDMALKNELVRVRSARKRIDPAKYLRQGADSAINTNHIAINACRAPNPLESEKLLDGGRWHALDELVAGHWFDLDSLLVYALKLSILEKWDRISSSDAVAALESALAHN